ncbi:hypothetical protein TNCV_1586191 [Trichonephila clavipes]|nr:hypothetical protein TNCV_1586191 [Trichonephila clavipes]
MAREFPGRSSIRHLRRPLVDITMDNSEKEMQQVLDKDQRLSIRMVVMEFGIPRKIVHHTLIGDFQKRKVCVKMVSYHDNFQSHSAENVNASPATIQPRSDTVHFFLFQSRERDSAEDAGGVNAALRSSQQENPCDDY